MKELFNEDLEKKDVFEIADWLKKVRMTIKKEDFEGSNSQEKDYQEALLKHFEEWREHQERESKFYDSEIFSKANILLALEKTCFKDLLLILEGKKKEWKVTYDEALNLGLLNLSQVQKYKSLTVDKYMEALESLDNNEEITSIRHLREEVCKIVDLHKTHTIIQVYFEDIDVLKNIKNYTDLKKYKVKHNYEIEIGEGGTETTVQLLGLLDESEIAKQTYYNYKNTEKETEIGKKFFINLGLFLALSKLQLEPLMNREGYTLEYSQKISDQIVWQCIMLGTGRDFMAELLNLRFTLSIDKRDFQNRMPSLAFIAYYSKQTKEKQKDLHTIYQKALEATEDKIRLFFEKINEKIASSEKRLKRFEEKNQKLEEEKWKIKAIQYQIVKTDEEKENIVNEAINEGWALEEVSSDLIENRFLDLSYVEEYLERIKGQQENNNILIKEEENKILDILNREYEIKDLFTNYKSRERYTEEVQRYIDIIERFRFTVHDIKTYLGKKKADREIYLNHLLL